MINKFSNIIYNMYVDDIQIFIKIPIKSTISNLELIVYFRNYELAS